MKSKKKNRREKNNEREIRIKRMSVFGLKIETRDDFDENNYEDFQNVRREIKDTTQSHRIGPAPVQDFSSKQNFHSATSPGSLDSDLEEQDCLNEDNTNNVSKAGCRGLIMYFSKLGRSEGDERMDFEFVDSLLRGGADINFPDRHGQTCMHEIARGWHTDVAQFALTRRAQIDKCDNYGRTPLHLATAVNYPEMVFWLLNNGARLDAQTKGENQTPIHYAAKHNAVDAMKVLLHMGANLGDRDFKNRTPLFIAAEMGRSEACRFLLEQGSPAGVYDDGGTSALTLMIEKMPDIAKIALGQFEVSDKALRKKYFYLNYLESETWKRRATIKGKPLRQSRARTPLEAICRYNENDLIMHPVILRLIAIKWQLFGKFHTAKNTCLNLLYTILWTILGVTMPKDERKSFYTPLVDRSWRIILEALSLGMAFYFIARQVLDFRQSEKLASNYKEWKRRETERDLQYCHARWPEERRYLTSEISLIKTSSQKYFKNGWNVFELFTNLALASVVITRIVALTDSSHTFVGIHYKAFSIFLIMLWLRFMRSCQCYQSLGPFITMLGHVITDTMKFGFLFMEFFIPYVCAFWILFGGHSGTEFFYFNDVLYNVFLMTLVDEYDRDDIMNQDKVMAQILVGSYLAIASVVCVNLYIALMSQTFTRVYQNAKATAFMQQAYHLLHIESTLGRKQKNRVKRFMLTECSPQVVYDTGLNDDDDDDQSKIMMYRMVQSIQEIKDKLLVLVMHSTNGLVQNNDEENISISDVNTQVEIVRRKCDSLESQLDDLQSYMHQIKEMIETKSLVESHQFDNIDDVIKVLPNIQTTEGRSNKMTEQEFLDPDPENIRKISNIEEKLNRVIDVLSETYQHNRSPNRHHTQYQPFPAPYPESRNVAPTPRSWYYESDSPYSSSNYRDHRYNKRSHYFDDRRPYYDQRSQHFIDCERSETLSDFEEFQKFKEIQRANKNKDRHFNSAEKLQRSAIPLAFDNKSSHYEIESNHGNEQYNTFPSSKRSKKFHRSKPTSSVSNPIDGRQSRPKIRQSRENKISCQSDDYERQMSGESYYTTRNHSMQSNMDQASINEAFYKNRHRPASDSSSHMTRRNSNPNEDIYSSTEDLTRRKSNDIKMTRLNQSKERTNSINQSLTSCDTDQSKARKISFNESRKSNSSLNEPTDQEINFYKARDQVTSYSGPKIRNNGYSESNTAEGDDSNELLESTVKKSENHDIDKEDVDVSNLNSTVEKEKATPTDSSGSNTSVHGLHRKSLHSLLKKYGLDPQKFEQQVEETNLSSKETLNSISRKNSVVSEEKIENTKEEDDINSSRDDLSNQSHPRVESRGSENQSDEGQVSEISEENIAMLSEEVQELIKRAQAAYPIKEKSGAEERSELNEAVNNQDKTITSDINDFSHDHYENSEDDLEDENNNSKNEDSQPLIDNRKPVVKINSKNRRTTWTLHQLAHNLKDTTL